MGALPDERVCVFAHSETLSRRGQYKITDLNHIYLEFGGLHVQHLSRGHAWLDTGQHDGLMEASGFVRTVQCRQGMRIACLEEIAFEKGFIGLDELCERGRRFDQTPYGVYPRPCRPRWPVRGGLLDKPQALPSGSVTSARRRLGRGFECREIPIRLAEIVRGP